MLEQIKLVEHISQVAHCSKLTWCFNPNGAFLSFTKQNIIVLFVHLSRDLLSLKRFVNLEHCITCFTCSRICSLALPDVPMNLYYSLSLNHVVRTFMANTMSNIHWKASSRMTSSGNSLYMHVAVYMYCIPTYDISWVSAQSTIYADLKLSTNYFG